MGSSCIATSEIPYPETTSAAGRARLSHADRLSPRLFGLMRGVDHPMQMRRGVFDVVVLVLPGSAFGANHGAAMDIGEIAVWKFVMSLGLHGLLVIHPEIPFAVLSEAV